MTRKTKSEEREGVAWLGQEEPESRVRMAGSSGETGGSGRVFGDGSWRRMVDTEGVTGGVVGIKR